MKPPVPCPFGRSVSIVLNFIIQFYEQSLQELRDLLTTFMELVRAVRNQTKSPELHAVLAR